MDAPKPKSIFCFNAKPLEKLPRKKTVSEYTWGLRNVKPNVLNVTDDSEFFFLIILKFNLFTSFLILVQIKCNKKIKSNRFNISSICGVNKLWK